MATDKPGLPRFEIKRVRRVPHDVDIGEPCVLCAGFGRPRPILHGAVLCTTCFRRWAIGAGVDLIVGGFLR